MPGLSINGNGKRFYAKRVWHALTPASIIYRATSNLRAAQILLGHSKFENTVCHLGIDVEYALALAENTEI
jgi:site-specific recombinase XerC